MEAGPVPNVFLPPQIPNPDFQTPSKAPVDLGHFTCFLLDPCSSVDELTSKLQHFSQWISTAIGEGPSMEVGIFRLCLVVLWSKAGE